MSQEAELIEVCKRFNLPKPYCRISKKWGTDKWICEVVVGDWRVRAEGKNTDDLVEELAIEMTIMIYIVVGAYS